MAFGCVKLQTCAQRRYTIRNCSADLLILDCSIATLDNTPSSVFSLQTASHLALQPGEATTLILAYAPHAVQEDVALLKLQPADPAQTRHAVCLLGFGGAVPRGGGAEGQGDDQQHGRPHGLFLPRG